MATTHTQCDLGHGSAQCSRSSAPSVGSLLAMRRGLDVMFGLNELEAPTLV
jgi:hypothetical protein